MTNDNNPTNGTFRRKSMPFAQVSNTVLRDAGLSLKAKGLYSLIQSYITIPDFVLSKRHLISMCMEGERAFDSTWKELQNKGYLKQYRIPKGKRNSFVYEYELLDVADLTTPAWVILNKRGEPPQNIENNENEILHPPHFVPHAECTPCEPHPMQDAPHAKWGGYNNTDLNNTDTTKTKTTTTKPEKNVVVSRSGNEITKKEPDATPIASDSVKKLILDNLNVNITKKQVSLFDKACGGDTNRLVEKIQLLKKQDKVDNVIGWLLSALQDNYQANEEYINKKPKKNGFINYEQREWDYNEIEKLALLEMPETDTHGQ